MSESYFEIVLDVLAHEIDMLRYQLKALEEENEKLRNELNSRTVALNKLMNERDADVPK